MKKVRIQIYQNTTNITPLGQNLSDEQYYAELDKFLTAVGHFTTLEKDNILFERGFKEYYSSELYGQVMDYLESIDVNKTIQNRNEIVTDLKEILSLRKDQECEIVIDTDDAINIPVIEFLSTLQEEVWYCIVGLEVKDNNNTNTTQTYQQNAGFTRDELWNKITQPRNEHLFSQIYEKGLRVSSSSWISKKSKEEKERNDCISVLENVFTKVNFLTFDPLEIEFECTDGILFVGAHIGSIVNENEMKLERIEG